MPSFENLDITGARNSSFPWKHPETSCMETPLRSFARLFAAASRTISRSGYAGFRLLTFRAYRVAYRLLHANGEVCLPDCLLAAPPASSTPRHCGEFESLSRHQAMQEVAA